MTTDRRIVPPYPADDHHDHHDDLFNLGLQADTNMMNRSVVDRRKVLAMGLAGIGVLMVACDTTGDTTGDTAAPTVSLTSSTSSLSAAGTITLTATASDNVGVTSVKFYRGTTLLKAVTSSPYTATDSITASGTYSYTAVATDAAGNSTTSKAVSVVAAIGGGTATCAAQPTETQGPYPADGSSASGQTLNILDDTGIVRSDLRTSFGTGNTVAGVPLTLTLKLVNVNSNCAALSGYVIYIWHCTADGKYSMYSSGITGEDYLRGVQVTDSNGQVSFTTIVPGCYSGRWPHIHFEVYKNLAAAATGNVNKNVTLVSQMALPQATAAAVYADSRYTGSLSNLNSSSLSTDNIFSDGYSTQILSMSGSNSAGYTATLTIGLSV